jgi:hypothetical protein
MLPILPRSYDSWPNVNLPKDNWPKKCELKNDKQTKQDVIFVAKS